MMVSGGAVVMMVSGGAVMMVSGGAVVMMVSGGAVATALVDTSNGIHIFLPHNDHAHACQHRSTRCHCKNRIVIITKGCLFPEIHYRNKLNFVQITIFFPKLIYVCVIWKTFCVNLLFFFGLFDQFILCYLRFIIKTNLIC